jgi:hypothetical protein
MRPPPRRLHPCPLCEESANVRTAELPNFPGIRRCDHGHHYCVRCHAEAIVEGRAWWCSGDPSHARPTRRGLGR